MDVFSTDEIANMHDSAVRILEELGMKVLLPEARRIYAAAGARIDEDSNMVFIGARHGRSRFAYSAKVDPWTGRSKAP